MAFCFPISNSSPSFLPNHIDPLTGNPYIIAQKVNCSREHTFSLSTVEKLFQPMKQGKDVYCPLCKEIIILYEDNVEVQKIVKAIFKPTPPPVLVMENYPGTHFKQN